MGFRPGVQGLGFLFAYFLTAAALIVGTTKQLDKRYTCSEFYGRPITRECDIALSRMPSDNIERQFESWQQYTGNTLGLPRQTTPLTYEEGNCGIQVGTFEIPDIATWHSIRDLTRTIVNRCVSVRSRGGHDVTGNIGEINIFVYALNSHFVRAKTPDGMSCTTSENLSDSDEISTNAECAMELEKPTDFAISAYWANEGCGSSASYCDLRDTFNCCNGFPCTPLNARQSAVILGPPPSSMTYLGACIVSPLG